MHRKIKVPPEYNPQDLQRIGREPLACGSGWKAAGCHRGTGYETRSNQVGGGRLRGPRSNAGHAVSIDKQHFHTRYFRNHHAHTHTLHMHTHTRSINLCNADDNLCAYSAPTAVRKQTHL